MDVDVKKRLLVGFFRVWPGLQVAVDDLPLFVGLLDGLPSGRVAEHKDRVKAIQNLAEFLGVAESDTGDAAARRRSPEDTGADGNVAGGVIKIDSTLVQQAGAGSRRHSVAYSIADGQPRAGVGVHGELEGLVEVHERWHRHVAAVKSRLFDPLAADGDRRHAVVGAAVNPSWLPLGKDDGGLASQVAAAGGLRPQEHDMAQIVITVKHAFAQRRHRRRNDDFIESGAAAEGVVTDGRDRGRDDQRLKHQASKGIIADSGDGQSA
ncbi:MAG: hypothetical protein BWX73_01779 [Lentisphaerae bacterium ADurb.Bin082]|nr:MAG: hypothetical protein BWX73_01779 [Lentisphaerae bacterium ADurb.Bin082]